MGKNACLDPAKAGMIVVGAQWFYRAYIALVVAAFFGLMLFPQTAWIYHDARSLWLLSLFAAVVFMSARGLDRVCTHADIRAAWTLAAFQVVVSAAAFCAFMPAWRFFVGLRADWTAPAMLVAGSALCAVLCWTCQRAVDVVFACATIRRHMLTPPEAGTLAA